MNPPPGQWIHYHLLLAHKPKSKAYLFQGSSTISVFDLETETWSQVATRTADGAPWKNYCPGKDLIRYVAEIHGNNLYVFGGAEDMLDISRNLLMALDLTTMKWRILSGTVRPEEGLKLPGLRQHAASWSCGGKFYVTLGSANRSGALVEKKPHAADTDFNYRDLWSYDIASNTWTEEKYAGNSPCLRTEVGYTFNEAWNRAIVFGGYCPSMSLFEDGQEMTFSYFGDTFAWNPETRRWAQVITRGFPTYRALADMISDPETGRTFLFGGCKSSLSTV